MTCEQHSCKYKYDEFGEGNDYYGNYMHFGAFDRILICDDNSMWIDNGEYMSRVNFCPLCGQAAGKKMNKIKD